MSVVEKYDMYRVAPNNAWYQNTINPSVGVVPRAYPGYYFAAWANVDGSYINEEADSLSYKYELIETERALKVYKQSVVANSTSMDVLPANPTVASPNYVKTHSGLYYQKIAVDTNRQEGDAFIIPCNGKCSAVFLPCSQLFDINQPSSPRTLTSAEWEYVISRQDGEGGAMYAICTITDDGESYSGLMLFPDGWVFDENDPLRGDGGYHDAKNTITSDRWYSRYSPNGAAFLPLDLADYGQSGVLYYGYGYWASTAWEYKDYSFSTLTYGHVDGQGQFHDSPLLAVGTEQSCGTDNAYGTLNAIRLVDDVANGSIMGAVSVASNKYVVFHSGNVYVNKNNTSNVHQWEVAEFSLAWDSLASFNHNYDITNQANLTDKFSFSDNVLRSGNAYFCLGVSLYNKNQYAQGVTLCEYCGGLDENCINGNYIDIGDFFKVDSGSHTMTNYFPRYYNGYAEFVHVEKTALDTLAQNGFVGNIGYYVNDATTGEKGFRVMRMRYACQLESR